MKRVILSLVVFFIAVIFSKETKAWDKYLLRSEYINCSLSPVPALSQLKSSWSAHGYTWADLMSGNPPHNYAYTACASELAGYLDSLENWRVTRGKLDNISWFRCPWRNYSLRPESSLISWHMMSGAADVTVCDWNGDGSISDDRDRLYQDAKDLGLDPVPKTNVVHIELGGPAYFTGGTTCSGSH